MVIRQRAIQEKDKELRRNAILDAAEQLFLATPERIANVADVAAAAGLAKGTVYLYFPSKEELLLALHHRLVERFFSTLQKLLARSEPVSIDDMLELVRRRIVRPPAFLPLASRCLGLMETSISESAVLAHKLRIAEWLDRAGRGLERHFPALAEGRGATLLMQSYALTLGLWQLLQKGRGHTRPPPCAEMRFLQRDYQTELDHALRALWLGYTETTPTKPAAARRRKDTQ